MNSKSISKKYAEEEPGAASQDQAVAPTESEAAVATDEGSKTGKTCADCGSDEVTVTVGEGDAERDYCALHAPANAPK